MPATVLSRRNFVQASSLLAAGFAATASTATAREVEHSRPPRRLLKTLKIGMVDVDGDIAVKLQVAKQAGFDGIELNSPGIEVDRTRAAIQQVGLPVDGSVCSTHWKIRHSDADPAVRQQALADLQTAIRETHAVGGHTVLLVVGDGNDGSEDEVWQRSVANIRQALPLCAELGITIAIENVWNRFLYDPLGPANQTADKLAKYVDEFKSPWVGMQFDIGNHWKFGDPAEWIRTLGHRIVKLDIKGFSRAEDKWADITEDDLPWADVRRALDEIDYHGWVAAEVNGGNVDRLTQVARQIDMALNIA